MASYVLVVDDEKSICELLRRQLEGWGYSVQTALSAAQALEIMLVEPASIAIIDLKMPGRDGLWLADQFRKRWEKTAVVIATGTDDIASIEQCRQMGAVDYVLKPFDREMLRQAMIRASSRALAD
jgi:CheY-like chemotaxis protein